MHACMPPRILSLYTYIGKRLAPFPPLGVLFEGRMNHICTVESVVSSERARHCRKASLQA